MKDVHFLLTLAEIHRPDVDKYLMKVTHSCSSDTVDGLKNCSKDDLMEYVNMDVLPDLDGPYSSCVAVDARLIGNVVKSKREEVE